MSGMEGGVDPVRELLRVQEVKWPLALEAGYTVSLLPVSVKDYERSQKPLLWNDVERRSPPLEGGRGPTQEGGTVLRRRRTVALRAGNSDFAASRAYYGCFYVAEALLLSEGLRFSRYGQVVAQYGRRFLGG